MKQYFDIKSKHPGALLLFRVGDFYETFGEDAIKASKVLGIVLTNRNNGGSKLELAGFPHHSLNTYLPKLVRAGYRVAICDQLEAPSKEKKIVKRGVTELVTPGVAFNDQVLDHKTNNFLAAVYQEKKQFGVSFLDVTTGEFLLAQGDFQTIEKLIESFDVKEVLYNTEKPSDQIKQLTQKSCHFALGDWVFTHDYAYEKLTSHFQVKNLKGFAVENHTLGMVCAGAILHYLTENKHTSLKHISNISVVQDDRYVWLDGFTIRNLELIDSHNHGATTLLDVIDHTQSPMGARLLKRWLTLPLKNVNQINERLSCVEALLDQKTDLSSLSEHLNSLGDLERLSAKIAVLKAHPKELLSLKKGLQVIGPIQAICEATQNPALKALSKQMGTHEKTIEYIEKHINEEAPVLVSKGAVIKSGINSELDELREISKNGKDYLLKLQEREMQQTGISSLKVGFNNVFGYYLEVRNTHKDKVPEGWIRKQTLTSAERYITQELKDYEEKILSAESKILELETQIYADVLHFLTSQILGIQKAAFCLAKLDCLTGFALLSKQANYVKPLVDESHVLDIKEARHPVIEKLLPLGEQYVSNSVFLDDKTQQIIIITGPNMVGKSALLRQTAIVVLLAQIGSFVPAQSAHIGLIDKIFTRVGASDNISAGESTFMVEMSETASILNNVSDRSLVLLDEIGRGTSTYDGISIAWAITEFLHENKHKAKTLFATHYHELNEMTNQFKRIKNYNVSVKEIEGKIIFLRKLIAGGSAHSFGIHVARLAGIPKTVVEKADAKLKSLESKKGGQSITASIQKTPKKEIGDEKMQLSFFQLDDPILEQIRDEIKHLDIDSLTPVEALVKLNEIKKLTGVS